MEHGITSVATITMVCYFIAKLMRTTSMPNKYTPLVCGIAGGIIGIVCFYTTPSFPATDMLTAVVMGIQSGLAATGAHQVVRHITTPTGERYDIVVDVDDTELLQAAGEETAAPIGEAAEKAPGSKKAKAKKAAPEENAPPIAAHPAPIPAPPQEEAEAAEASAREEAEADAKALAEAQAQAAEAEAAEAVAQAQTQATAAQAAAQAAVQAAADATQAVAKAAEAKAAVQAAARATKSQGV